MPFSASALSARNDSVLSRLDEVIDHKAEFSAQRDQRIEQLKRALGHTSLPERRFTLSDSLFNIYLHYQADSALNYVQLQERLAEDNMAWRNKALLHSTAVMSIMGMYVEALAQLEKIDVSTLNAKERYDYFCAYRGYYGWIADYSSIANVKKDYERLTRQYRDSILSCSNTSLDRVINLAEKRILDGESADSSILILNALLDQKPNFREVAYIYYTLAEVYESMGNMDMQIYYLAQTAIVDIQSAVREYASLQKLAVLMYQAGNIERAYHYLSCSMEDAVACNARLRFIEVTNIFPIIDKAYQEQVGRQHIFTRYLLISISFVALVLIAAFLILYFSNKKMASMRASVGRMNKELLHVNRDLSQTNTIKEAYIGRYLDRCVAYLDKLDTYRRSLLKLSMASRTEELFRAIKSEQFINDERKAFYQEFDKSFIELFPHFITDFNNLLEPEGRITPKAGEILSPELRIFALIRLGVTDSNRIAHFLGYSLATIYNYRSKMRSRAINHDADKERFEQDVMKL